MFQGQNEITFEEPGTMSGSLEGSDRVPCLPRFLASPNVLSPCSPVPSWGPG